ncbi:MAG: DUF4465 domain-containing protein [Phycisphaeraceae bacterium]|nr:DUF4465 domain-containing protein [Phycisphaeraceae bacterium]
MNFRTLVVAVLATLLTLPAAASGVADFEDLALAPESHWSGDYPIDGVGGEGQITTFTSGCVAFTNYSDGDWSYWRGFAYSNVTDNTTPGYGNQFSAFPGSGVHGSANYAVADTSYAAEIILPTPTMVLGGYFTNTTYAALSMLNGDAFAKKFGGPTGEDPDFLLLTVTGRDGQGQITGTVELYLADYTQPAGQDVLLSQWTWVDLIGLGESVKTIAFAMTSSDVGPWGINTPTYFALDDLTLAPLPEPATLTPLLAAAILVRRARPRK